MSNILKKIISIEPDDADVLDAINAIPEKQEKAPLISSIEEEDRAIILDAERTGALSEETLRPVDDLTVTTPQYSPPMEAPQYASNNKVELEDTPPAIDESRMHGTARQGLQTQRASSGKQIQHPRPIDRITKAPALQHVEQAFAHPV